MRVARAHARAFTLAEVVVCLLIVGVAITAGLQSLGSFAIGSRAWRERSIATVLANQLMAEINALPYADPSGASVIGRDAGETTGTRTTYDDIDDYDGWNESPPKDASGNVMTQYSGYRQQVSVVYDTSLATKTGLTIAGGTSKKITVTVSKDNKILAKLTTIRTQNKASS